MEWKEKLERLSWEIQEGTAKWIDVEKLFESELSSQKAKVLEILEGMTRKTTDKFEMMLEIRIQEINEGKWATADIKAGYNQALKDIKLKLLDL